MKTKKQRTLEMSINPEDGDHAVRYLADNGLTIDQIELIENEFILTIVIDIIDDDVAIEKTKIIADYDRLLFFHIV